MSNLLSDSFANDLTTVATLPRPREVLRCCRCLLVQFRTIQDRCRRCASPLPSLDFMPAGKLIVIEPTKARFISRSTNGSTSERVHHPSGNAARQFDLGPKLKKLRKQLGLTQKEIAVKAKIPRTYISRIENARLLPGPAVLHRIAGALAVGVADLLASEDSNRNSMPEEFLLGSSIVWRFSQLRPEQMSLVLSSVRNMVDVSSRVPLCSARGGDELVSKMREMTQLAKTEVTSGAEAVP